MILNVACPAKVNLFLAVGPKDSVGYHPIRTVFQAIGLFDEFRASLDCAKTTIEFAGQAIPAENTVTKAHRLLSEFANLPPMAIHVQKRIPSMAGLGGGSSNAAALIRLVRYLVPERITEQDAFSVAEAVGADVPFFLVGGKARGEGYGERLTPLPDTGSRSWMLVIKPPYGFSTPEMYAKLDAVSYHFEEFPESDRQHNDFERVICYGNDVIERISRFGGKNAGLSGSGSAVYGLFDTEAEARSAEGYAKAEDLGDTWVVPTLSRAESLQITTED